MLKPVELCLAGMKPLAKRCTNTLSKDARARRQRKYNELLAKDLTDPANATKRTARHFILIREAMEYTRQAYKCFCPYLEGTTEASLRGGPECVRPTRPGPIHAEQGEGQGRMAAHPLQPVAGAECKATTRKPATGPM